MITAYMESHYLIKSNRHKETSKIDQQNVVNVFAEYSEYSEEFETKEHEQHAQYQPI